MTDNIRLALKGIWSHRLRSFLTMLGIIIGIASIITIVSTINGTNEQIKNNLIGSGTNTVTAELNVDGYVPDYAYEAIPSGVPALGDSVKESLLGEDEIESVSIFYKRNYCDSLYFKNTSLSSAAIFGIDTDYFETAGYVVVKGRGFTEAETNKASLICVIDETCASGCGVTNPIGDVIDIMGKPYTIVGIVKKSSEFEPVIDSEEDYYTYMDDASGAVYIPKGAWPVSFKFDEPAAVMVKARSTDDMTKAGQITCDLLNGMLSSGGSAAGQGTGTQESGLSVEDAASSAYEGSSSSSELQYKAADLTDQAQQLSELSSSTNNMLIGIASISLLVGGIGVMNIMLVSVTERTREIGLRKALGAKKRTIRGQFLTEAAMLSVIGGALGVIVGIILANIISSVAGIPVAISVPAVVIAVAFSMLIGIVFGLVPSVKAANLNPIDALRYE